MKKLIVVIVSLLINLSSSSVVLAEELIISGNGDNSQNQVNISQTQTTTVTQTNQADVQNNVASTADTGSNQSLANSGGETNISTGNITSSTNVENNLNSSTAQVGCCPTSTAVEISGNGTGSENSVDATRTSQTSVSVTQNASIDNQVSGYLNTGYNSASNNGGNVTISTGDIYAQGSIENIGINLASVKVPSGSGGDIRVNITDNGSSSVNSIKFNHSSNTTVVVNNNSTLNNILNFFANTGGNSANGNLGDVTISTGDIFLNLKIKNRTNESFVDIDCCPIGGPGPDEVEPPPGDGDGEDKDKDGDEDKEDNGDGDNGDDGDNGGGNGGGGPGEVLGASLPATGNNSVLGLTLLALIMLGWGIYLRTNPRPKKAFVLHFRRNILHLA